MFAWIPLFPLVGVLVNGLLGTRVLSRKTVERTAVGMVALSFGASWLSFFEFFSSGTPFVVKTLFSWIPASFVRMPGGRGLSVAFDLAFRYDSLAAVMTLVVTGVGLLIHIYSIGYMAGDKGYARFFTFMNLFTFAMLVLVLGANLAVMFIGWEGVGFCSYLLIGFWFSKDAAANAAKKAFITNRAGDFGFVLGMGLLVVSAGTLDIARISAAVEGGEISRNVATAAALLLFLGATGKSAQIPLYTWLPDAMEGPTPVSALIHAATMVTAGVYMVARMHALFSFSGTALAVVAAVGAFTAIYAAVLALAQSDIKRVLAYSTISQIGYMFIGLGVGAYAAGIFHLVTHAFFKSLLFLAAGSVIHALSGEQDMRKMGGLRAHLPRTFPVFLVGALAIAGIPGLSGFFSKDEILTAAFASRQYGIWALGLIGAGLTAFYIFRLIFLTFYGPARSKPHVFAHVHESPSVMLIPLQILAALAAAGGILGLPHVLGGRRWVVSFLESSTGAHKHSLSPGVEVLLMLLSSAIALAGIGAAYYIYVRRAGQPAIRIAEKFKTLSRIVSHKFYVDECYNRFIAGGAMLAGRGLAWFDDHIIDGIVNGLARVVCRISSSSLAFDQNIIDGAVNGLGSLSRLASSLLRRLQTGFIYNYALSIVIGIVVIISLVVAIF